MPRSMAGAVVGTLIGVGAGLVLGQQGALSPSALLPGVALSAAVGLVLATLPMPVAVVRVLTGVSWLAAVGVLVAVPALPAAAVPCAVEVDVDGPGGDDPQDLFATTLDDPVRIPLEDGRVVVVTASADVPPGWVIEVRAEETVPPLPGLLLETLRFEPLEAAGTVRELTVVDEGLQGFVLRGPSGSETRVPPLGTVRLRPLVGPPGETIETCDGGDAWVRFVTAPGGNPVGWVGTGMVVLGLLLLPAVLVPRAPRLPPPPPLPAPRPDEGAEDAGSLRRRPAPVPSRGAWHLPDVETRVVDAATGEPLPADAPLVVGGAYELRVTVAGGVAATALPSPAQFAELVVLGDHDGEPFPPTAVDPRDRTAVVSHRPTVAGTSTTLLEVVHRGHLLQSERVELPVVAPGAASDRLPRTRTVLAAGSMDEPAMAARTHRDVLVVVEVVDGGVATRVHAPEGTLTTPVGRAGRAPATVDAMLSAARQARTALTSRLAGRGGTHWRVPGFERDDDLAALARAGRQLRHALLGPDEHVLDRLHALVGDGATVQVVQDATALGPATLPHQLLYDHPLSAGAADLRSCGVWPHPVDTCPSIPEDGSGLVDVVCPSGLWGHRAVIEEVLPRTSQEPRDHPSVGAALGGGAAAHVDPDPALVPRERPVDVVAELGLRSLPDLDAVVGAIGEDVGLLYLLGHTTSPPFVDEVGFAIGRAVLLGSDLRERGVRRPAGGIVVINACGSGAGDVSDVTTLVRALLEAGTTAVVGTETTMWAPFAAELGAAVLRRLVDGAPVGRALLDLRRQWLEEFDNHVGLTFRLHGSADATWSPTARSDGTADSPTSSPPSWGRRAWRPPEQPPSGAPPTGPTSPSAR